MTTVKFFFNGNETLMKCQKEDKINDICHKFASKIGKDFNSLSFIHGGNNLNLELTFNEQINLENNNLNENKELNKTLYSQNKISEFTFIRPNDKNII